MRTEPEWGAWRSWAGPGVNEVIHPTSGRHLELCAFNKDGVPVWGPWGGRPSTRARHLPAPAIAGSRPALSVVVAVSCVAGDSRHPDSTHWMTPPAVTIPSGSHHHMSPGCWGRWVAETTTRGLGSGLICPPRGVSLCVPCGGRQAPSGCGHTSFHERVAASLAACCSGDCQAGAAHAPPALQTSAGPPAVRAPAPTGCPGGAGRRSRCPRAGSPEPRLSWGSRGQVPRRASRPGARGEEGRARPAFGRVPGQAAGLIQMALQLRRRLDRPRSSAEGAHVCTQSGRLAVGRREVTGRGLHRGTCSGGSGPKAAKFLAELPLNLPPTVPGEKQGVCWPLCTWMPTFLQGIRALCRQGMRPRIAKRAPSRMARPHLSYRGPQWSP